MHTRLDTMPNAQMPVAGSLAKVYQEISDAHCRYSQNAICPVLQDGGVEYVVAKELLEIGRNEPSQEHLMIAYFGDRPTRVTYSGENPGSMSKTVARLKLPRGYPSNLGEKVFYLFRQQLADAKTGPILFEVQVTPGKEHQFSHVLRKLVAVYAAEAIKQPRK